MPTLQGFRMVPNGLFFEQIEARRRRSEPFEALEAWCSLDYDLFRHGRLASERAYAAGWKRSRGWLRGIMRRFRQERGLPEPAPGRPPQPNGSAQVGDRTI